MDLLKEYVQMMDKEDIRHFRLYLSRTGDLDKRMDMELFEYIHKKGDAYDDEFIFKKLYKNADEKNNFYRLKNRLISDINKSLLIQYFNENIENELYNYLNLAQLASQKNKPELALRILTKAERKAQKENKNEILDLIYTQILSLSTDLLSIPVEELVEKRNKNLGEIEKIRKIDDTLSIIRHNLQVSQNFSSENDDIIKLLEKHVKKFSKTEIEANNQALRFRIYEAVSKILLQKHDYIKLEVYLKQVWKEFTENKLFNKTNHSAKLQILTNLSNALFKNNKFTESLEYTSLLKIAMEEYDKLLENKFLIFYYNTLIINYSVLDRKKAIEILETAREDKRINQSSFYYFILLNLALLYFKEKDYRASLKNLVKLYSNETYAKSNGNLKLKIAVFELMIRCEMKDIELFDYRFKQVLKDFDTIIKLDESYRDYAIMLILKNYTNNHFKFDENTKADMLKLINDNRHPAIIDTEIITYSEWLKEKIN